MVWIPLGIYLTNYLIIYQKGDPMENPCLHHLTVYKTFDRKWEMTFLWQAAEVSQNRLDQDLKRIVFYQTIHLNKYL